MGNGEGVGKGVWAGREGAGVGGGLQGGCVGGESLLVGGGGQGVEQLVELGARLAPARRLQPLAREVLHHLGRAGRGGVVVGWGSAAGRP